MSSSPVRNVRVIAGGASIGFVLGSLFGFYTVGNNYRSSYYEYDDNSQDYFGKNEKHDRDLKQNPTEKGIVVGSLLNKSENRFSVGIPVFWWDNKTVALNLLNYNF